MKYAVLDWDNTIRKGYTLFDLVDFLITESVLPRRIRSVIDEFDIKYRDGLITHDQYAQYACREFAQSLAGCSVSFISDIVKEYINIDRKKLFSFSNALFDFLDKNDIAPIIVSGAPRCVVLEYREVFRIEEVYAFEPSQHLGEYTGMVSTNYGYRKKKIVSQLIEKYGVPPFIGAGDSASDYPLIQASQHGFYIGSFSEANPLENITYIPPTISEKDVIPLLSRCTSK